MAVTAETCFLCHSTDPAQGALPAGLVNQNNFHDYAASDALYKGSISIESVSWVDATTTTANDSVVPLVNYTLRDATGLAVQPTLTAGGTWPVNAFALGAAKYVASANAPGNFQFSSVILNAGTPSSANCSAAPVCAAGVCSCTFTTRKILRADWDPASSPANLEIGIQMGSGFTVVNPTTSKAITFMANGTALLVGGTTITTNDRQVVTTTACNQCHGRLALHGRRVEAQYCTVCHTTQINNGNPSSKVVPGNGDFSRMIHGLHASAQMGLNYSIAGVVGAEITYPQDVRNCTTCHQGTQAGFYLTMPTASACLGCHEDTLFSPNATTRNASHQVSGTTASSPCVLCHTSAGLATNHAIPGADAVASFGDPAYVITSVTSTGVGQFPVVTFRVTSAANSNLKTSSYWTQTTSGASRLAVTVGWKTGSYTNSRPGTTNTNGQTISTDALAKAVAAGAGTWKVTSAVAMPADVACTLNSAGTSISSCPGVTVTIEGHPATSDAVPLRLPIPNAVGFFSANPVNPTLNVPTTKKAADYVVLASCNDCHKNLSLHGNNRQGSLEVCTTCHNTEATDKGRRPAAGGIDGKTQVPIDFKTMIHEIHTANIVVYGFGGSVNSFEEVTYPMPLSNCQACHAASATAYFAPQAGLNGTTTELGATGAVDNLRTTPWFATCGSCHTQGPVVAHMRSMGGGTGMTQAQINALNGTQPVPALKIQ